MVDVRISTADSAVKGWNEHADHVPVLIVCIAFFSMNIWHWPKRIITLRSYMSMPENSLVLDIAPLKSLHALLFPVLAHTTPDSFYNPIHAPS
jgi:hypothetical protein